MKIAHITGDVIEDKITGPKESLTNLSNGLRELGHEADIFSINNDKIFFYNSNIIEKIEKFDVRKYDVIVLVGIYYPKYFKLILKAKLHKKKVVISPRSNLMYDSIKYSTKKKIYVKLFQFLMKRCVMHYLSDAEKNNSKFGSCNYFIAGNGVSENKVYDLQGYNNIEKVNTLTIGYMGRLDITHKGIDILFEAIKMLATRISPSTEVKYKFIFYGPAKGDFDVNNFISRIPDNVIIEYNSKPLVTAIEKSNFFSEIDYFIHSSRYEGLPQSVLESIANGIPVIVSNTTNLGEIVTENELGYAYYGGVMELCDTLTALSNPVLKDKRKFLQEKCKEYYKGNLDWKNVSKQFINGLEKYDEKVV